MCSIFKNEISIIIDKYSKKLLSVLNKFVNAEITPEKGDGTRRYGLESG
jgi:hypothetical protein